MAGELIIKNGLIVSGSVTSSSTITAAQHIEAQVNLKSMYQAGDEGGEIFLNVPATNTTINSGVNIDVYQNKLRFWENGGANRGYYLDIPSGSNSVGTSLIPSGFTGVINAVGSPPKTLTFANGILVSAV